MVWLENLPDDWWKPYESSSLSPQCVGELDIELLFLIRSLLLETRIYARVCKRVRLLIHDFQHALHARNIRLHRSVSSQNNIKQSREFVISIPSIIRQADQFSSNLDRIQLTMHWLAIDGEQPIIPENPSPNFNEEISLDENSNEVDEKKIIPSQHIDQSPLLQKLFELANTTRKQNLKTQNYVHSLTKNNLVVKPIHPRNVPVRRSHINQNISLSVPSPSSLPSLAHELSIEQQLYFKSLTESCFNGTNQQRLDAFHCLASDAALQPLVPRLLLFISKGIETNIYSNDLDFILQFLSILKMLTLNTFISFDKYLHSIIPSLLSSLVCLFDLPRTTNASSLDLSISSNYSTVWIMREQASDLINYFEKKYSSIPHLTQRISSIVQSNINRTAAYSIAYACIRTLFSINTQIYSSFAIDMLRNCRKMKTLEADFDLDSIEQQSIFDQKINELFKQYHLSFEESDQQNDS